MTQLDRAKREQLLESGHCLFADVLDQTMLERLRRATDRQLDTQTEEQKGRFRSQGSMFGFDQTPDPRLRRTHRLAAGPRGAGDAGYTDVTFTDAYLISKPPTAPRCSGTTTGSLGRSRRTTPASRSSCSSCTT